MQNSHLIIGGSSVSGRAAVKAIRAHDPAAFIVGTSSRTIGLEGLAGFDAAIGEISMDRIHDLEALSDKFHSLTSNKNTLKTLIYVPARGEVGLPAHLATPEQVRAAVDYSLRPMLKIRQALKPELTICISGFITMQPLLECYGAMAYAKIAMEQLVLRHPDALRVIRYGMFHSSSVRGIALLVQRNMQRRLYPEFESLKKEWRSSGIKRFSDFFYDKNYRFEEQLYKHVSDTPFRPTVEKDLVRGFAMALESDQAPIVNILGDWSWTEDRMPDLPPVFHEGADLMPDDLDQYF